MARELSGFSAAPFAAHALLFPYLESGEDAMILIGDQAYYYICINEHEFQWFADGQSPTNYTVTSDAV